MGEGDEEEFEIEKKTTLEDLRNDIEETLGIPYEDQELTINGKEFIME